MEQESFEDTQVAELLRADFVAVKVDKEERPDIDAVYMQVTQALTGSGGWPMTVLLAPDKTPFFAGTYFPKNSRYGMSGIIDILKAASRQWKTDRSRLTAAGSKIVRMLDSSVKSNTSEPSRETLLHAYEYFCAVFDKKNGGFGAAPKFPSPHNLMFLMRYGVCENEPRAVEMAETTLTQMYRGGLFDHIGGGFSRYSTDARWLVPHFEKMLYDNALLTIAYLEAYRLTGNELFRRVAVRTLDYVQNEMTDPQCGFYCAQDADSDGHEGRYYVWSPDELITLLGHGDGKYLCNWLGVTKSGNFEGYSIPNLLENPDYAAKNTRIEQLCKTVYGHRQSRVKLHKDDKVLTSWNSMMIVAFADAYRTLGHAQYLAAAERAVAFIRDKMTDTTGRLRVSYRDGEAKGSGYLDDYAYYVWALLALYDASFEPSRLESALFFADIMCSLFEDNEDGGFYMYSSDAETLMTRPKETYDGATPSGNSVAAYVLCKLAALTGDTVWEERAERQLAFMAAASESHPASYSFGNLAALGAVYPTRQLICALPSGDDIERLREVLATYFTPDMTVIAVTPGNREKLTVLIPSLYEYSPSGSEPTFYVCEGKTCGLPFTGFDKLSVRLNNSGTD